MRLITQQKKWIRNLPLAFSFMALMVASHSVLIASEATQAVIDKAQLKLTIEKFLEALGNDDTDAVRAMYLPHASVGFFRKADGKESVKTMSIEQYIEQRRSRVNSKFTEPVQEYEINISQGKLAFVRANATIYDHKGEIPSHHTQDFFVLMNVDGVWKFLSASYTSSPLKSVTQ
ncbi:MAG: hypothetical protein HKP09_09940 [Enterobacterales bacterium]|nr:hypothetical protein [Enterobacterales bacterium]